MAKIHPTAVVDGSANLDDTVDVGPYCVIGPDVWIGARTVLEAHVVIERDVTIGQGNRFCPQTVIGGMPQVLGWGPEVKVGGVLIGDHNTVREQVTIHRSMYPGRVTRVGSENLLMVGVHLGHDCVLEDRIVLTNCVHLSGHCKLESGVWLSGLVALHQFVTIGRWAYSAGMTSITKDVPPFLIVCGSYPTRVRGVNVRGLRRAGFNDRQQHAVCEAYRRLYRHKGGCLKENARTLAQEDGLDPAVHEMLEAIDRSSQHRFGRYLESFRH